MTNPNSGNISGWAIDQNSGRLTPLAGSPFTGFGVPTALTIDPSGKFAYVAFNQTGICAFTINSNNGKLIKVPGSPFAAGSSDSGIAVWGSQ